MTHEGFNISELPFLDPGEVVRVRDTLYVAEDVMQAANEKQGGTWNKLDALAKSEKGKPHQGNRKKHKL